MSKPCECLEKKPGIFFKVDNYWLIRIEQEIDRSTVVGILILFCPFCGMDVLPEQGLPDGGSYEA